MGSQITPPEMIANFDETMIQCTAKRLAVVGHADASTLYISQSNEMPHITLGMCVFADGTHPEIWRVSPRFVACGWSCVTHQ